MKKLIFLSGLLLLASSTLFAQQRDGARNNGTVTNPNRGMGTTDRPVNRDRTIDSRRTPDRTTDVSRRTTDRDRTDRNANDRNGKPLRKLLGGLHLSDDQKRATSQILKEAKENGTPKNEVLREINSILTPRQSEKFKKKIKRLHKNNPGSGTPNDNAEDTPVVL